MEYKYDIYRNTRYFCKNLNNSIMIKTLNKLEEYYKE